MNTPLVKMLSILVYIDAFIWIIGVIPTLYYVFNRGVLPTLGPITLLGGPFEKLGLDPLIVAGIIYVFISGMKILAAYWLQNLRLDGAILELILLGLSAIFWYGFALPLGPILGVIQVILIALAWGSLS